MLEQVERNTGNRPKELDLPRFPEEVSHVWGWFFEMHSARTFNNGKPNPLNYMEIYAWSQLSRMEINPEEVRIIREIDSTYLRVYYGHYN